MKKLIVYCDASIVPKNPGGRGVGGFVVKDTDAAVIHKGVYDFGQYPQLTNNFCEYGAVAAALQWLARNHMLDSEVVIKSDSQLVVRQMRREYKCLGKLRKMREIVDNLAVLFPKVSYEWIPREQNTEADELSRSLYVRA